MTSSVLLQKAVEEFSKLPGIGEKSAFRLVMHLLNQDDKSVEDFGNSIIQLKKEIIYCRECHNISDTEVCAICSGSKREKSTVCVVESIKDVSFIENTHQYNGVYHVLGGVLSPMDGVGPSDIKVQSLFEKVANGEISEIILALSTTTDGDTTNFYIYRKLQEFDVNITTLARGVAVGGELEYTDGITLGRSIVNRLPYEDTLSGRR